MVWSQVSIENIARDVAALAGVSHLLEFDTSKADGQFRKPASCDVLTSKLPEVAALERDVPPPLPGRSTHEAIAAGIGWGIRGAIARLVEEARAAVGRDAELILTGGWRGAVRDALPGAVEMPDLVLAGIALAAERACNR